MLLLRISENVVFFRHVINTSPFIFHPESLCCATLNRDVIVWKYLSLMLFRCLVMKDGRLSWKHWTICHCIQQKKLFGMNMLSLWNILLRNVSAIWPSDTIYFQYTYNNLVSGFPFTFCIACPLASAFYAVLSSTVHLSNWNKLFRMFTWKLNIFVIS